MVDVFSDLRRQGRRMGHERTHRTGRFRNQGRITGHLARRLRSEDGSRIVGCDLGAARGREDALDDYAHLDVGEFDQVQGFLRRLKPGRICPRS